MNAKTSILFLCTGNSCRSQMAEGWANHLKHDTVQAYSAGIEQHGLNPDAVAVMAEVGVDISPHRSKVIGELPISSFDWVVTLCGHAHETCPYFPGKTIHRGFDDPPKLAESEASEEEKLKHYRRVRDEIRTFVAELPDNLEHLYKAGQDESCLRKDSTLLKGKNMEALNQMLKTMDFNYFGTGQHSMGIDGVKKNLDNDDFLFLDLRTPEEHQYLALPFMTHIPLHELPDRIGELPADKCIVTFCSAVFRAAIGFLYLQANGFDSVKTVTAPSEDMATILKPGPLANR